MRKRNVTEAYTQGFTAYYNRVPFNENPYRHLSVRDQDRIDWIEGYTEAADEDAPYDERDE